MPKGKRNKEAGKGKGGKRKYGKETRMKEEEEEEAGKVLNGATHAEGEREGRERRKKKGDREKKKETNIEKWNSGAPSVVGWKEGEWKGAMT